MLMDFDLSKAIRPALEAANQINSMNEDALNAVNIRNRQRDKAENAMIEAAKHTSEIQESVQAIDGRVDKISTGLDEERKAREDSEKDNLRYVKKMDKINLTIAIIGAVFGTIGTAAALIALFL